MSEQDGRTATEVEADKNAADARAALAAGHSAEKDAPTTDCPVCGRSAKDCNDSHAKGWDGCCMACDEVGRSAAHRLRMTPVGGRAEGIGLSRPCANDAPECEVPAAPPTGSARVLPPAEGRA